MKTKIPRALKSIFFAGMLLGSALLFSPQPFPGDASAQDKDISPIKIGAIFSVTGKASSLGLPEKQTVEMLAQKINKAGGINGRPLEMFIYDDQTDETLTVTLAERLLNEDKVKAIIGPTISGASMAIIETVSAAPVPLISCAASYKIVIDDEGRPRKWVFKTPPSDSMAVERIYDYLAKNKMTKIALLTATSGFGEQGRTELQRLAPNFGVILVADKRFGSDDADMTPQLIEIKATKAQAIVVWGLGKAVAIISRNANTLGLKQQIVQSWGVVNQAFLDLAGDAAEGQVLPASRMIVADQLPDTDPQKELLVQYKRDFEDTFPGAKVSIFGGYASDAFMLLMEAIKKAGSDDPAKVRDSLEQIKSFAAITGIFSMSANDHNGLSKDAFVMVKIENHRFKLIQE